MMPDEKTQLLALLDHDSRWCRNAEALDAQGNGVAYDDDAAVAWDLTGALCLLFGWPRACALFEQLDRHLHGKRADFGWPRRDAEMDAMGALQVFNDGHETTFALLRERIETMPVWHGHDRGADASEEPQGAAPDGPAHSETAGPAHSDAGARNG